MADFVTFQEFMNNEDAQEMAEKLEQHGITARVEKSPDLLGRELIGNQYNSYTLLQIPGDQFKEAQQLLIDDTKIDMSTIDRNHMLFSLSNDELTDVIAKPDEWGAYNYTLAGLILKERRININAAELATLQKEHLDRVAKQRPLDTTWLLIGYFFSGIGIVARLISPVALLIIYRFWLLPGILGIIMGAIVLFTKRILPDGSRIMSYDTRARKHGLWMFLLGIFAILFNIVLALA